VTFVTVAERVNLYIPSRVMHAQSASVRCVLIELSAGSKTSGDLEFTTGTYGHYSTAVHAVFAHVGNLRPCESASLRRRRQLFMFNLRRLCGRDDEIELYIGSGGNKS